LLQDNRIKTGLRGGGAEGTVKVEKCRVEIALKGGKKGKKKTKPEERKNGRKTHLPKDEGT